MVINDVMVDCGVAFSKIKDELYDIKYLLLTHVHGDHIKPTTLKSIKQLFPRITVIGNYEVHQLYEVDVIANAGFEIPIGEYTFIPFECEHDVLTYGYTWYFDHLSILYATDTSNMQGAPVKKYDYMFLESNYDQRKIEQVDTSKYGYNVVAGAMRHLSTQQAKGFYFTNRRNKDSVWVELHKSSRFY